MGERQKKANQKTDLEKARRTNRIFSTNEKLSHAVHTSCFVRAAIKFTKIGKIRGVKA